MIAEFSAQVIKGVDLVGQSGSALGRVMQRIGEMNEIADLIARTTSDQAATITNVSAAAREMDRVTQDNARRVTAASEASLGLLQETNELSHLITRFEIGDGVEQPVRSAA